MAIMRFDPLADLDRMLELVSGRGTTGNGQPATRSMPIDIYRVGDEYVVEMDLPGVDPSSIDISVERNMLTVEAEAQSTHEQVDDVVVCERRHAKFRRQLYLGDDVNTDNVRASYDNGVLRLRIPIAQNQRAHKIDVDTSNSGSKQISDQSNTDNDQGTSRERQKAGQSAS
jgi:HSP20 family protein